MEYLKLFDQLKEQLKDILVTDTNGWEKTRTAEITLNRGNKEYKIKLVMSDFKISLFQKCMHYFLEIESGCEYGTLDLYRDGSKKECEVLRQGNIKINPGTIGLFL